MGLPTPYQEYIHLSRYARYRYDEKRRETWEETVERYFEFFKSHLKDMCDFKMTDKTIEPLKKAVINLGFLIFLLLIIFIKSFEFQKFFNIYLQFFLRNFVKFFAGSQPIVIYFSFLKY